MDIKQEYLQNKRIMHQYGLSTDENGDLIIAEALNHFIIGNDAIEILARLSLLTLWVRGKNTRKMTNFIHSYVDEVMSEYKDYISCGRGCYYCCRKEVNIFPDEGALIKEFGVSGNDENDSCLFLSNDGECKVYEVRPVACRNHVTVGSPELCKAGIIVENIGDMRIALLISAYTNVYDMVSLDDYYGG